jgi:hypothetical protein
MTSDGPQTSNDPLTSGARPAHGGEAARGGKSVTGGQAANRETPSGPDSDDSAPTVGPPATEPDGPARSWRSIGPDLRPLSVPAYRRLFLGQVFTVVGAMITAVAVQQQVFDLTGSSAWVGFASLVALVPLVIFGLLGGAIADTYDRRKLLIVTSIGIAVTSIGLWLAALAGSESVWTVFALLALQQAFFAVNQPPAARSSRASCPSRWCRRRTRWA